MDLSNSTSYIENWQSCQVVNQCLHAQTCLLAKLTEAYRALCHMEKDLSSQSWKLSKARTEATRLKKEQASSQECRNGDDTQNRSFQLPTTLKCPFSMPEDVPVCSCNNPTHSSDSGYLEMVCESLPATSLPHLSRQVSQPSKPQVCLSRTESQGNVM